MELLISLGIGAVLAAVLTKKRREAKADDGTLSVKRRITDINTLLQNIEVYDGTSKGQKKIGGDIR